MTTNRMHTILNKAVEKKNEIVTLGTTLAIAIIAAKNLSAGISGLLSIDSYENHEAILVTALSATGFIATASLTAVEFYNHAPSRGVGWIGDRIYHSTCKLGRGMQHMANSIFASTPENNSLILRSDEENALLPPPSSPRL